MTADEFLGLIPYSAPGRSSYVLHRSSGLSLQDVERVLQTLVTRGLVRRDGNRYTRIYRCDLEVATGETRREIIGHSGGPTRDVDEVVPRVLATPPTPQVELRRRGRPRGSSPAGIPPRGSSAIGELRKARRAIDAAIKALEAKP